MAQGQMQQAQGAPQQARGNFLADTRQALITGTAMVPPVIGTAGLTTTQQLPTSGYLSALWFILTGTTTTNSAQTTTALGYPEAPWGFIRKIRIYSNMGTDIWNTSGYGAYLYMRSLRTAFDPQKNLGWLSYAATDGGSNNSVFSRLFNGTSSLGASSTETWKAPFYIPTAWGTLGNAGLQLLQDDAVKWYLEITWGDLTNLYSATSGGPTLSAVSLTPVFETFSTPRNPINRPDLSYSKLVIEEQQPFDTGSGVNTYKFVTGNMVTRLIHYFDNQTSGVAKPLDPTEFTNMRLDYASTQVPYNILPDVELFRESILYASLNPQGVYRWEFSAAAGLPEFPSMRDVINTIKLTNLQSEFTLTGVTPSNSAFRTIKEMLSPNRRF